MRSRLGLIVCVAFACFAGSRGAWAAGTTDSNGPYTVAHDSGGNHTHKITAHAERTSPIHQHEYTSGYPGGYIPVYQAGWGKFETSQGCVPLWQSHGWLVGGDLGTSGSDDDSGQRNWLSNNEWVYYFTCFDHITIANYSLPHSSSATMYVEQFDDTFNPLYVVADTDSSNSYTIVP